MFVVYIIYSAKLDRYYVGTTDDFERRFIEHNSKYFDHSFTSRGAPWNKYLVIDGLESEQAYKIEKHIKNMRFKLYVHNLSRYPEMITRLKEKYK